MESTAARESACRVRLLVSTGAARGCKVRLLISRRTKLELPGSTSVDSVGPKSTTCAAEPCDPLSVICSSLNSTLRTALASSYLSDKTDWYSIEGF